MSGEMDRINDTHYRRLGGDLLVRVPRHRSLSPTTPIDNLAGSGPHSIERYERFSTILPLFIQRLNQEQLLGFKGIIFDGADYRTDDATYLHGIRSLPGTLSREQSRRRFQPTSTLSTMPTMAVSTGQSLHPLAIRAELPDTTMTF